MSLLADALQPYLVGNLTSVSGRMELMTLADSVTRSTAGYTLNYDSHNRCITVDFGYPDFLMTALASDCSRLSCACFQTMISSAADIVERDNVAWTLIKVYYSAFYGGHAILRIFGNSCSFFDKHHTSRLLELGPAFGLGPEFRLEPGLYECVLNENATAMKCTRARAGAGGAHESFWEIFGRKIGTLAEEIMRGPLVRADAQAVFAQIEELRTILKRRAGYSWLSGVRNDLQYRHQHGVWYPSAPRARERDVLNSLLDQWSRNPMNIDLRRGRGGTLGDFVSACTFIVALCHTILVRIAERSTAGARSFVQQGPLSFLNARMPQTATQR